MPLYMPKGGWDGSFFGLDVVELLIGLSEAVLFVKPEFLYVSRRIIHTKYPLGLPTCEHSIL
jgi:hypothetical protein